LPATILPLTGPLHQDLQEIAARAAVAARPARALDLRDGGGPFCDDRLDGAIRDPAAETDDHRRGLPATADGSIIRVPFRSLLGSGYNND